MRRLLTLLLLLAAASTVHANIVINEIMYNSTGYDNEWVELYNAGASAVSLEGWYLLDDTSTHTPLTIPAGYTIAAGEYFTIAIDHQEGADPFPFTPDYDATEICEWNLGNNTDTVNLYQADGTLHDTVSYDDEDPWPTAPDGNGPSLELITPTLDNSLAASWQASAADGGTPGEANSSMNAPVLTITPDELDYGMVDEGQTYSLDAELANSGTVDLVIETITLPQDGSFSINEGRDITLPLTITPGDAYDITVSCVPELARDYTFSDVILFEGNFTAVELPVSYTIDTEETGAVINEIMYNSSSYDNEWVELYNMDSTPFLLEGFTMRDDDEAHTLLEFPAGASIPAEGYYTIAIYHDPSAVTFPFTPDYDATEICEWNLNNTSDVIYLFDADGNTWDMVGYFDTAPWPTQPDGSGPSLELINPALDNNDGANWQASAADGGSPGEANSGGGGSVTVATIAELRQQATGTTVYTISGEVVLTYQQTYRSQKYIQDGTAAVLIDDYNGIITTQYEIGDGITGISGTISEYGGMLEFAPTADPGAATSSGNVIAPQAVTLAQLTADFDEYEGELITIVGLVFDETGTFANGTVYAVHDGTATYSFRTTFYDVDYIGTPIPIGAINVTVIPNSRTDGDYISARNLADFSAEGPMLGVSPSTLSFGGVLLNETSILPLLLLSTGSEDVVISNISVSGDGFEVYADEAGTALTFPLQIAPANTDEIYVYFTPTTVAPYAGTLTITSNVDPITVSLQGSGSMGLANIVINEIMYNPSNDQGDDSDYEWLELYNAEDVSVDIGGWSITTAIDYTFDTPTVIEAGGYLVVAVDPDSVMAWYDITNVVGPFSGGINNDGETIQLLDGDGSIADFVTYNDSLPWPTAPDGAGPSLELIDPSLDNSFAENWQASYEPYGTPGIANSVAPQADEHTIYEIQYSLTGPSPYMGDRVITQGVVTAVFNDLFFIQDGSGPWNGIAVVGSGVELGDVVSLTATVTETYYRTTLSQMADLTITGSGSLPEATTATTADVASNEAYEGVLVRVVNAFVTDDSLGYGEWEVNDGTGVLIIDDYGDYSYTPVVGDSLNITGVVEYDYGNFMLEPRNDADILPGNAAPEHTQDVVTGIKGNFPNPFNPVTTVAFSLAAPQRVELNVYNIRGQRVRTLVNEAMSAGDHSVVWRGDDDHGRTVASGIYFLRMQAGSRGYVHKALLLK